ncbi:MAG TPA: UPF0182 family protein [Acidimicrobiales bacterium]|nr:UPF0182 family protein [Acidimicrobiales bacterium]
MRTPADMPRRLPRTTRRSRIIIAAAIVVLIILIASLSGLANFWTDYLWFQSVGFTSVFRGVVLTKLVLALVFIAIFFLLMWGNLLIADRYAPLDVTSGGADELVVRYRDLVYPHGRWVRLGTAAIFSLLAGIGANREWNNWDLLRYHVSFGAKDPQFHKDIGFYVFELPFIKFLLGWTFEALIIVLVITALAHYLNGGIHLQGERRVTPAVKTHLSVLLGVLAIVKGVDYYFQRLELVLDRTHVVNGATATDVHATLPARTLLIAIAVIAAALFLYNIRQKGWTLPAVAVGLWALVYLLVGQAYPAIYQALRVSPSELTKESAYITRNINATRAAYGINKVTVDSNYTYSPTVTQSQIQGSDADQLANQQTIANVRLLDPAVQLKNTFDKYQALRSYYEFNGLDLDRYVLPDPTAQGQSGQLTATIASVRELNQSVPSGFVNQHLEYTHGYGAVLAPISQAGVSSDGTPNFSLSNLPPSGLPQLGSNGSQIYYGEGSDSGSYVIAASKTPELDYQSSSGVQVTTRYAGHGGVNAGSIVRRAAFALRFRDANFILSGQITPSSKVMFIRNISDRVHKAAPFLKYDADPYAVVLGQQLYWVVDAYTTTDNYPYSQNANIDRVPATSGLSSTFNYVRNSVKVVVSAYDGSMHFFVTNTNDPIIKVYERAFPDLFTPISKADSVIHGIVAHFRFPEDVFRVQTNMFGRYHLTAAPDFYTQAQAWAVSPDPGSGQLSQSSQIGQTVLGPNGQLQPAPVLRLQPQYILAHLPQSTQQSFILLTPFVPVSTSAARQNLTAYMTASSDPQDYGALRLFETPAGQTVDGPALIANAIRSNVTISTELSYLNQNGSTVELGEVAVVPIDNSLLYVQPVYVESSANPIPTLKDVIVVYGGQAYHSSNASLDNALCQVANPDGSKPFSSYCGTLAASAASTIPSNVTTPGSGSNGSTSTTTTPTTVAPSGVPAPPAGSTVASLLAQAKQTLDSANTALKNGDLATYQKDVNQAEIYVQQAQSLAK